MLSDSPYRRSLSIPEVIVELRKCSKIQFDPRVVKAAVQLLTEAEIEERTGCPAIPVQTDLVGNPRPIKYFP